MAVVVCSTTTPSVDGVSSHLSPDWLPLNTALNLRDVGGLPAAHGHVRHGVLLRSGSLQLLSATDAQALHDDYRVRTVVDLRTAHELAIDGPSRLARLGAATVHLPLIGDLDQHLRHIATDTDAVTILARGYRDLLDRRGHHIVTAARLVAWSGPGAMLVHCALGKDRTGVVVAVLLDAAGVDRAAILADYTATNDVLATALPALAEALGLTDRLELIPFAARVAHPDALAGMFEHLDRDLGGAATWLRACGLDRHELHQLRRRLVSTDLAA